MDWLTTLGQLTGLAFISGLRLYSAVLAIGLGLRLGFLHVPDELGHLRALSSTPVLIVAGVMYVIEFVADKVPWVDSAWDAIHTFIRPLGAALLAASALVHVEPTVRIGVFLVCGTVGLSSHSAKAGARVIANHSPEPFTNIGLSLFEDGVVATGAWMAFRHPLLTLAAVGLLVSAMIWLLPRLFRAIGRRPTAEPATERDPV